MSCAAMALRSRGLPAVRLDGDRVRTVIDDKGCGHDRESRLVSAWRICRPARELAGQRRRVIAAPMSMYPEIYDWNRANLPNYFRVHIRVGLDTLRRREPKGLYQRQAEGQEANLCGVDCAIDEPSEAHLLLENDVDMTEVEPLVQRILDRLGAAGRCASAEETT